MCVRWVVDGGGETGVDGKDNGNCGIDGFFVPNLFEFKIYGQVFYLKFF